MAIVIKDQADWSLPLREHQHVPTGLLVSDMMRALLRGQADHHGSADYKDVGHAEAEAGVVLAATLVAWFTNGAVTRKNTTSSSEAALQ